MLLKQLFILACMLWALMVECRIDDDGNSVEVALRELQERQIIYLPLFDIELALNNGTDPDEDVNVFTLKNIVQEWMDDSFREKSVHLLSTVATFDYTLLEFVFRRRRLERATRYSSFYKVEFRGFTVWNLKPSVETEPSVNTTIVELMQNATDLILRATLLEDNRLLELLRQDDWGLGLGDALLDVRASNDGTIDDFFDDDVDDSAKNETLEITMAPTNMTTTGDTPDDSNMTTTGDGSASSVHSCVTSNAILVGILLALQTFV